MNFSENAIKKSVESLDGQSNQLKRKFAPNVSKGLAKKSSSVTPVAEKPKKNASGDGQRGRINRRKLEEDESRFIQSYSIFEKGIGCVTKADSHSVELKSVGNGTVHTSIHDMASTEIKPDPVLQAEAFIKDIKQCFKDSPTTMPIVDMSAEPSPAVFSESRSSRVPTELFDETSATGSLFMLQLPENLLSEESPILKGGKFGKIQILDNGESRLVISDSSFRLICPNPTNYSTDVVLIEDEVDGLVNMTSLGHIDQFVSGVPDFDRFSRLGR